MKNHEIFKFLFTNSYRIENEQESDLAMIADMIKSFDFYSFQRNINSFIDEMLISFKSH